MLFSFFGWLWWHFTRRRVSPLTTWRGRSWAKARPRSCTSCTRRRRSYTMSICRRSTTASDPSKCWVSVWYRSHNDTESLFFFLFINFRKMVRNWHIGRICYSCSVSLHVSLLMIHARHLTDLKWYFYLAVILKLKDEGKLETPAGSWPGFVLSLQLESRACRPRPEVVKHKFIQTRVQNPQNGKSCNQQMYDISAPLKKTTHLSKSTSWAALVDM